MTVTNITQAITKTVYVSASYSGMNASTSLIVEFNDCSGGGGCSPCKTEAKDRNLLRA
ncbi:MAG: hypothetical protein H0W62_11715 [Chitinophagales bacterium]|nr:hypothetical protein [Chitinophagales bacterium]